MIDQILLSQTIVQLEDYAIKIYLWLSIILTLISFFLGTFILQIGHFLSTSVVSAERFVKKKSRNGSFKFSYSYQFY